MTADPTQMQKMVDKLAKERKSHIDHIENMTFRNLKVMVSLTGYDHLAT